MINRYNTCYYKNCTQNCFSRVAYGFLVYVLVWMVRLVEEVRWMVGKCVGEDVTDAVGEDVDALEGRCKDEVCMVR